MQTTLSNKATSSPLDRSKSGLISFLTFCLLAWSATAWSAPTPVPISFTVDVHYTGDANATTASIYFDVGGTSLQETQTLPPSKDVPTHTVGTATALLIPNRVYTFKRVSQWNYQGSDVSFNNLGCYQICMYDPAIPDVCVHPISDEIQGFGWGGGEFSTETLSFYLTNGNAVSFAETCKCQESDFPQLIADGLSQTVSWVTDESGLTWGFEGDSLDCKISPILNGDQAIITSGRKTGSVTVTATRQDPYCVFRGALALVCAEQTCSGGQCSDFGGGTSENNNGIDFNLGLGGVAATSKGGHISLVASTANLDLAKPKSLSAKRRGDNMNWIWCGDSLRQVNSPLGLVDIVTVSPYEYQMKCYQASDVTGQGQDGIYTLNGGATPIVTWTVKNPDTSGATYNELWIVDNRSSVIRTNKYVYDSGTTKWQMVDDTGIRSIYEWETYSGTVTNRFREIKSGSTLVYKIQRTYDVINNVRTLKQVIEGDGTITNITTYTYTSGQLSQVDYPDGRWDTFEYDSNNRVANMYSAYGDQGPTNNPALCKLTQYAYTLSSAADGVEDVGTYIPNIPRKTIVKIKNQEVSRAYKKLVSGQTDENACPTPSALWTDSANILTTTKYIVGGVDDGRVKEIAHPDGTMTFYTYTNATYFITTNKTGEANAQLDGIQNGTETVTTIGDKSQILTNIVRSIEGGNTTSTVLSSQRYTYLDSLNQSYQVVDLGNKTNTVQWGCCGLFSETDGDGTTTTYDYDYLKRRVASTKSGITTTNVLDAAGNVLVRQRLGTDSSTITLEQFAYDVMGRVTSHTNALNGVSTYSESLVSNKLQKTTTYHDGGTRIETYYRDGRLEKVTGTAVFPVRYDYDREQDGTPYREYSKETKLDPSFNPTSEWAKTYADGAGYSYKTLFASNNAPYPYLQSTYNNKGQLLQQRDPDGIITLYAYNAKGEQTRTAIDMDQNGVIEANGSTSTDDRITDTLTDVLANGASGNSRGTDIRRSRVFVFTTDNSSATNLISTVETSTDGLKTWRTVQKDVSTAVTTSDQTAYGASGYRTNTVTNPDGTLEVSLFSFGRLASVTRKDSGGGQVTKATYAYDAHGRVATTVDARNGATTYAYNNSDQATSVIAPGLGNGEAQQVTSTGYDNLGRPVTVTQPDGTTATSEYFLTGLLKKIYGSRTYPVEYTYDPQGRMKTMKTWQDFAGNSGTATTTWNYDAYRGWLSSKDYPDATTGAAGTLGPTYTYKASGRLLTRLWQRGITTTYAYNNAGDLSSASYSDTTPGCTYTYDRRGRRATTVRNSITTTLAYNDADQVLTEGYSGGTLNGLSVSNVYDSFLRRTNAAIKNGSTVLQGAGFVFDSAGRLQTVTDASATAYIATYAYLANSPLAGALTFKQNGTTRLTTSKDYDYLNRLTAISSVVSGSGAPTLPVSYAYQYNAANQRTRALLGDGSYWVYQYDARGQVTSGKRYWLDGTPVAGQQFEYVQDNIGNRTSTQTGGDATGGGLRGANYTRNRLNQSTQRDVPSYVDIMGVANPTASVTVNGNAAYRKGDYFDHALSVLNGSSPQYPTLTVISTYGAAQTNSGKIYVPRTAEFFSYDADGNLATDGRWTYTWDAENRLIEMKRDGSSPSGARQWLVFEYDLQGRRIRKQFSLPQGGGNNWNEQRDTAYLYDGWNLVGELDANASNAKLRTYIWGTDLSGSMQGAGGVGGLLKVTDYVGGTTHHFVAHDGNGNVSALVDGTTGAITARYEYGPFGEALRATGTMAKKNPLRFSTKYTDDESGLLYYGYRYYNPNTGRWLSQDPIEQNGGLNTYAFTRNAPLHVIDRLGLQCCGGFVVIEIKDVPIPAWQQKESGGHDRLNGFKVSYIPCEDCDCPPSKIRLVQARKVSGVVTGAVPFFDAAGQTPKKNDCGGISYPPYQGIRGPQREIAFIDAPYNPRSPDSTFSSEVCAVCKTKNCDKILACVSFSLDGKTRTLTVPGGKLLTKGDLGVAGQTGGNGEVGEAGYIIGCSDAGSLWNDAKSAWEKRIK